MEITSRTATKEVASENVPTLQEDLDDLEPKLHESVREARSRQKDMSLENRIESLEISRKIMQDLIWQMMVNKEYLQTRCSQLEERCIILETTRELPKEDITVVTKSRPSKKRTRDLDNGHEVQPTKKNTVLCGKKFSRRGENVKERGSAL